MRLLPLLLGLYYSRVHLSRIQRSLNRRTTYKNNRVYNSRFSETFVASTQYAQAVRAQYGLESDPIVLLVADLTTAATVVAWIGPSRRAPNPRGDTVPRASSVLRNKKQP